MKTIVRMQFGSHVYGTNLPTSDTDVKAVHIPDATDILLQRAKGSIVQKTNTTTAKNTAEDIDFESHSLHRFMDLLLQGQTIALNMLFTPKSFLLETSDVWERIVAEKDNWLHRNIAPFIGYCRQQSAKYGIRGSRVATVRSVVEWLDATIATHVHSARLAEVWASVEFIAATHEHAGILVEVRPNGMNMRMLDVCGRKIQETMKLSQARDILQKILDNYGQRALAAERNEGVDWKAVMHALRACGEAEELLTTGHITYPRPEAAYLLQVRQGLIPYKDVSVVLEERMAKLEQVAAASSLPDEPNRKAAEELIRQVYRGEVLCG